MEHVLEIENLTLTFHGPGGPVQAVRGVGLKVAEGEIVALVGESGCGKTALCRAILGLHSAHAELESGSIRLCGQAVDWQDEAAMRRLRGSVAAMIFQDPLSSLNPVYSVGAQIVEAIRVQGKISRKAAWQQAVALLQQVGIPEAEKRVAQYPHQFSGGMRQRVAIAIALAQNPALLIADEPTTALDADIQGQIVDLLRQLVKAQDGACRGLLFVTHDLRLVRHMADRVIVMRDGLVEEEGRTADIFAHPQTAYTRKLVNYANYGEAGSHVHGRLEENDYRSPTCTGEPLLHVQGLQKGFPLQGKEMRIVLQNVNLRLYPGEIVGLIGPSGCGKSTLVRCLIGIDTPEEGTIRFAPGCRRQMIFQDSAAAFDPRMKLWESIVEPLVLAEKKQRRKRPNGASLRQLAAEMMEQVALPVELMDRYPYEVSGGQRQRAAIARALITDPDLLIADEPVSSLDVPVQAQIIHLLKKLHDQRGLTLLLIAHDLPMVSHISDRIISLAHADRPCR